MDEAVNLQRQLDENKLEHNTFMQKLEKIWDIVIETNSKIDTMPQILTEMFDKKYASKNIEKWFYIGIGIIVTAFIGGLIFVVLVNGAEIARKL